MLDSQMAMFVNWKAARVTSAACTSWLMCARRARDGRPLTSRQLDNDDMPAPRGKGGGRVGGGGGWGEGMRSPQLAPPRSVIIFKLCQAFSRMIDNGCMFYVRACFLYQFYRADLPLALFSYVTSFLRSFEFQISARRGPGESIDHSRHH